VKKTKKNSFLQFGFSLRKTPPKRRVHVSLTLESLEELSFVFFMGSFSENKKVIANKRLIFNKIWRDWDLPLIN